MHTRTDINKSVRESGMLSERFGNFNSAHVSKKDGGSRSTLIPQTTHYP